MGTGKGRRQCGVPFDLATRSPTIWDRYLREARIQDHLLACRDRHDGRRLERFARSGPAALQVEAMLICSMFGWDVPGALPKMHRERDR